MNLIEICSPSYKRGVYFYSERVQEYADSAESYSMVR